MYYEKYTELIFGSRQAGYEAHTRRPGPPSHFWIAIGADIGTALTGFIAINMETPKLKMKVFYSFSKPANVDYSLTNCSSGSPRATDCDIEKFHVNQRNG
jgi:hypothetical protein